jgi:hypothetical protein
LPSSAPESLKKKRRNPSPYLRRQQFLQNKNLKDLCRTTFASS